MQTTSKNNPSRTSASVATVNAQGIKLSVQIFLMAVSFLCLTASCGGDDDPEASEPAGSLQLTDKGYTDGLLYYNITSQSTNEVAIIGAESTAVNVVTPTHVVIDGKTFSCTKIENQAFFEHKKLNTIAISNTIKEIGISAFFDCNSLTSVTISNSVTSIGNGAFSRCKSLTSITLGDKVTTLGDWAFSDCIGLTSITIPNSVTSIGNNAFSGCRALTSITIPSSVTSIGDYVFNDCSGLTSINVESGNREYDSRDNCNAIIVTSSNTLIVGCKNTIIPNSVTSIGNGAFLNCDYLTSVTIPNGVTSIGDMVFSGCIGLTSVTIPNSVTSIGNDVFSVCHKLETVKSEIEKPFEINAFDAISFSESTLIVPKGTKSLYQATSGWKEFVNITEEN